MGDLFGLDDRPKGMGWSLQEVANILSGDERIRAKVVAESTEQEGAGTLTVRCMDVAFGVHIAYRSSEDDVHSATMFPQGFPVDFRKVLYCWSDTMRSKTWDDAFPVPEDTFLVPENAEQAAASIVNCLVDALKLELAHREDESVDLSHPRRVWLEDDVASETAA